MRHGFVLVLVTSIALLSGASVFSAVGRTPGSFTVSAAGSANYTIPIWTPRGIAGLQPSIALTYSSSSGDGVYGVGWSVAGFSSLSRCDKTYAQDGVAGAVDVATSDLYCLDGNKLRSVSGTYGADGSVYQTEIANFSKVISHGAAGTGPAWFEVWRKDGLIYEYGNTTDSVILVSPTTSARTWALNKIRDRVGNYIAFVYINDTTNGVFRPSTITYVTSPASSATPNYQVKFTYQTRGTTPPSGFILGSPFQEPNLTSQIAINAWSGSDYALERAYNLTYTTGSASGRSRINTVTECSSTDCLAPTTVGYQDGTAGFGAENTVAGYNPGGGEIALDLNGDGIDDLIYPDATSGHWYYLLGSASGTFQGPYDTGIASTNSATAIPIDYNSDGKMDVLVENTSGNWRVLFFQTAGGAFTYTDTTTPATSAGDGMVIAGDVDGDGRDDLIYAVSGGNSFGTPDTIYYRLNTGSGFSTTATVLVNFPNTGGCQSTCYKVGAPGFQYGWPVFGRIAYRNRSHVRRADFNGDGRTDFLLYLQACTTGDLADPQNCGKTYKIFTYIDVDVSQADGSYWLSVALHYQNGLNVPDWPVFGDFNGDGCTDLTYPISGGFWMVQYSNCGRSGVYPSVAAVSTGVSYTTGSVMVADYDGDGRDDLLVAGSGTSPHLGVIRSTGTGFSAWQDLGFAYVLGDVVDLNGDGQADLVYGNKTRIHNGVATDLAASFTDGYGNSVIPTYHSIAQTGYTQYSDATFPYQNYIGPLYVVTQAVFTDPSNMPNGTYNQQFWYYGAWTNLQGRGFQGFNVINTYDSRTGLHDYQYYERSFPYTGMKYQDIVLNATFDQSESVGTTALTTLDGTANNERYFRYFSNWTSYQWEVGGADNSDLITSTSTNFTYDSYGNATNIAKTVFDNDPGSPYSGDSWTTSITNTTDISANQSADLAAWCLNMLDETEVVYSSTINGTNYVTRTKAFTPDTPANCRILSTVTEPTANNGVYKVTEGLTFDNFGNVQTYTVTGNNMSSSPASRVTTLDWGTTGQFLNSIKVDAGTVANPTTATTTWTYTSNQALTFGVPDSVKDANNLTTSWVYDEFGRKTQETRPDGTYTTWTFYDCAGYIGCVMGSTGLNVLHNVYTTNGSVQSYGIDFFDSIDRPLVDLQLMMSGTTFSRNELRYDSLGRVSQRAFPCAYSSPTTTCSYWSTNSYDVLNRLTSTTRPISFTNSNPQSTSYTYAGRKLTVTDPLGTRTTITDVNGWLRQTKDAIGYNVTRAYDAAGSVIGITDSVGNTLLSGTCSGGACYKYGLKSFLVSATDADRGAWTYAVDSLGERTGWTDANGQSFSMTYDALSRPLSRTEPDLYTQWTWGSTPASHNVGQLITECTGTGSACASDAYSESRTFDSYGRPSTRAITQGSNPGNDPGGVFLFTIGYNTTTGLPSSLTYPTPASGVALQVQYAYQNGFLQSVTDTTDITATCGSTCTLWTANAMNAFGQITQETLGNGIVTNRTYDAVTSWLSGATAGVGGGAALLNQSYLQDKNGNVIQRQQNNTPGITESFAYDADNRLTCTTLASTCTTPTLAYDGGSAGPGNITSQTGVGTYTYPAAGQPRPHAVTSITGTINGVSNPTFSYDANGNMTSRAGSTVGWSSYNYPTVISASDATGTEEVQFSYGPDRQRWKQIYSSATPTETTYYVGGLVDVVFVSSTTNYRHYVYAGSEPVAVYSRTAAGNTMSYTLGDHQGGISAIASNAGVADINESFTAFGQRRNPNTWSGAPTTQDLNTIAGLSRQGYTFQTWLGQSMGLNHMNGRVEDAILGRFLSPDPHVPDPSNAQSYNRYSYVNNNPLTFTDPTGFDEVIVLPQDGGGGGGSGGDSGGDSGGGSGGDSGGGWDGGGFGGDFASWGTPQNGCTDVPLECHGTGKYSGYTDTLPPGSASVFNSPGNAGGEGGGAGPTPPTKPTKPAPPTKPAQSNNRITPCPSGTLSNFAYALHDFGMNSMKTGAAGAVMAQNGLIAAAPYAETPAGADAVLVNEALGLASDFTFAIGAASAAIGGGYLAFNGDRNPLNATTTTLAQTIGEDAARVPNLSPTDPLDAPFESMAGQSTCRKN